MQESKRDGVFGEGRRDKQLRSVEKKLDRLAQGEMGKGLPAEGNHTRGFGGVTGCTTLM